MCASTCIAMPVVASDDCVWCVRIDDELLDVNGISVARKSVAEVGKLIHSCPNEFVAIVRPVSALKQYRPHHATQHANYATRLATYAPPTPPISPPSLHTNTPISPPSLHPGNPTVHHESPPGSLVHIPGMLMASSDGSISNDEHDDMGDYDDDDEDQLETLAMTS